MGAVGGEHSREVLKILLVYPRYPDTFWSFRHAVKFLSRKVLSPPLGLLTVAALLPKTWRKRLVDLNADVLRDEDIEWADYVFLSAMEVQQRSVIEIVDQVKARGKKIVAGGPLFTMVPERFQQIDHLILHEAEATLPLFVEDLRKREEKPIYTSTQWPDITSSPIPEWSLIDIWKYGMMAVQSCRGCPFDCDFCDVGLLHGKKPRTKTKSQVLGELEALYQRGWRGAVFFVDDNFIVRPERLKGEILPALINWNERKGYPFSFSTQASIGLAEDDHLMELLVKAGFDSVFVGIETPEEKSLYECHKLTNKSRDLMEAVKKMQRFGLEVSGGFIVGFDSDPPDIFEKQINFIQQSGVVTAMVGLLNAPRGTGLYERLRKEGRLLADFTGDNTDFSINFIPTMDLQQLLGGYKYLVTFIYSPYHFYKRLVTFLTNYSRTKQGRSPIHLDYIKAFLHSIWTIGVLGEGRFYYWKTLLWTVLRRPQFLAIYVRLAIYGYHFRKVFKASKLVDSQ